MGLMVVMWVQLSRVNLDCQSMPELKSVFESLIF